MQHDTYLHGALVDAVKNSQRTSYVNRLCDNLLKHGIPVPSDKAELFNFLSFLNIDQTKANLESHFRAELIKRVAKNAARKGRLAFLHVTCPSLSRLVFLDYLQRYQSTAVIKMLTSGHEMLIESGRINSVPKEERTCGHCDELEDEKHVLYKCPAYEEWRSIATNLLCPEMNG